MNFSISDSDKQFLLTTARHRISSQLNQSGKPQEAAPNSLQFNSGCFVTLHMNGILRGCIGNFRNDINIVRNVDEMANSAAFSDHRFKPLTQRELTKIDIEISVLSPMIPVESINDIQVGRDGLCIRKEYQHGVLLPQVATEQQWDREEFLSATCHKAGLAANSWQTDDIHISRFEAIVFGEKELNNK